MTKYMLLSVYELRHTIVTIILICNLLDIGGPLSSLLFPPSTLLSPSSPLLLLLPFRYIYVDNGRKIPFSIAGCMLCAIISKKKRASATVSSCCVLVVTCRRS